VQGLLTCSNPRGSRMLRNVQGTLVAGTGTLDMIGRSRRDTDNYGYYGAEPQAIYKLC